MVLSLGFFTNFVYLLYSYGALEQYRLNKARKSVVGLSLLDCEIRVWGKYPWIVYAICLSYVDWWLLLLNTIGIVLNGVILCQHIKYSDVGNHRVAARVFTVFTLGVLTLILCLTCPELIKSQRNLIEVAPILFTTIILPFAVNSQRRLNAQLSTMAISTTRYASYVLLNMSSLAYGVSKGLENGWHDSWTICAVATYGIVLNSGVIKDLVVWQSLLQIKLRYRSNRGSALS